VASFCSEVADGSQWRNQGSHWVSILAQVQMEREEALRCRHGNGLQFARLVLLAAVYPWTFEVAELQARALSERRLEGCWSYQIQQPTHCSAQVLQQVFAAGVVRGRYSIDGEDPQSALW
jgi:hypothetical protein